MSIITLEAESLAKETLTSLGRGTFACDCGLEGPYLDSDYIGPDLAALAALISHARFEHSTRRNILFSAPVMVFNTGEATAAVRKDEAAPLACCDGTGWTGNPRERCATHYEVPGFSMGGIR